MRPLDGYPTSIGSSVLTIARIAGPASYAQYTTPSTGGQDVQGLPNGVKTIDFAIGAVSDDGLHRAEVVQIEASSVNGVSLGRSQLVLKWYVVATGSEVGGAVDLSETIISLLIIGPK